jgi:adenosylcobinamide kinase / adenosylcobinamide-phosphate guanylyltransferase
VTSHRRVLVLGGARSGKSRWAQDLADRSGLSKILIATAQALDEEMQARIDRHRGDRDLSWHVREVPLALPGAVARDSAADRVVLVDCLTLWLSNLILAEQDPDERTAALTAVVRDVQGPVILVSNEVGHGVVPATPLGRSFRDAQGRLNQQVAAACDAVVLVTAGCPTLLKPAPPLDLRVV